MAINFTISHDTVEQAIADMKTLAFALGGGLPPMQEQPKENRDPAPAEPPKERKPRARKADDKEEAKAEAGEQTASGSTDATSASTENPSPGGETTKAEIPDIEAVRHALKTLGAADGFGHDKVFEVLGRYKATNASTVPEDRRAELIAEIEALLKGGK